VVADAAVSWHGRLSQWVMDDLASLVESVGFKVEEVRLLEASSNALYLRGRKGLG
jgi:hypothetical protein